MLNQYLRYTVLFTGRSVFILPRECPETDHKSCDRVNRSQIMWWQSHGEHDNIRKSKGKHRGFFCRSTYCYEERVMMILEKV